jgi:hypothetical protein
MVVALCGPALDWQPAVLRQSSREAVRPMPQTFLFGLDKFHSENHRYSKGRSAGQFVHDLKKNGYDGNETSRYSK